MSTVVIDNTTALPIAVDNVLTEKELSVLKYHIFNKLVVFSGDKDWFLEEVNKITIYMAKNEQHTPSYDLLQSVVLYIKSCWVSEKYGKHFNSEYKAAMRNALKDCSDPQTLIQLYQILDADYFMHSIADKVDRI